MQAAELYKGWVLAAGATVEGTGMVAVSARVSYGGEGLEALAGAVLKTPCLIRPKTGGAGAGGVSEEAPLEDGTHVYSL